MSELRISTEIVCFVIAKARALDAKVAPTGLASGNNPVDDDYQATLEDLPSDATEQELRATLQTLNGAEMADLIALMWLGRDDMSPEEWPDVLHEVAEAGIDHPVNYLMGTPLLGDYLDEALARFGFSCSGSGEAVEVGTKFLPG